jgi:phosphatidylglycerol:prolipoprotein diacylglycerol transferase
LHLSSTRQGGEVLADYLHNLNPILIKITDTVKIHWYGLAYVMGFICAYALLVRFARRGIGVLEEKEVGDFITFGAIFGVMLGGRLGYMLFYEREQFFANPATFFQIRDGGMASHGGILGLFFFTLYYSIRHKKSWTGLGDNLVTVSPLGLLFGRLANFVNSELYGNPVNADHPFAVRFPKEIYEDLDLYFRAQALLPPTLPDTPGISPDEIVALARTDPEFAAKFKEILTPRHPSQLYEAALEGLALFLILYFVRVRWPRAPHGMLTALFFLLYAGFRMFVEYYYRVGHGYVMGVSKGFFYSTFMIGIGLAFAIFALLSRRKLGEEHPSRGR